MSKTDAEDIFGELRRHHDGKFGFVIYRCTYGDDAAWDRFVARLTAHVHAHLDRDSSGHKIKNHFTWDIMEDKNKLDGASMEDVCEQHKQWRAAVGGSRVFPRYANCIYVDQEVIESVLIGDEPGSRKSADRNYPRAFVKVRDDQFGSNSGPPSAADDEDDEADGDKAEEDDEDARGEEDAQLRDVGWAKIAARALVPRAYSCYGLCPCSRLCLCRRLCKDLAFLGRRF